MIRRNRPTALPPSKKSKPLGRTLTMLAPFPTSPSGVFEGKAICVRSCAPAELVRITKLPNMRQNQQAVIRSSTAPDCALVTRICRALLWFGNHQPEHQDHRCKCRHAEPKPNSRVPPIKGTHGRTLAFRHSGEISHSKLQPHYGNPAHPGQAEQHERPGEPTAKQRIAQELGECYTCRGLNKDRRQRKQPVGQYHLFGYHPNGACIPCSVSNPLKECDSKPRSEQNGGADDVHDLEDEVAVHSTISRMLRSRSGSRNSSTVNRPMQGIAPVGS